MSPVGYEVLPFDPKEIPKNDGAEVVSKIMLKLNVTNHGLSNQVHDDIMLKIHNMNFMLLSEDDGSLYEKSKP